MDDETDVTYHCCCRSQCLNLYWKLNSKTQFTLQPLTPAEWEQVCKRGQLREGSTNKQLETVHGTHWGISRWLNLAGIRVDWAFLSSLPSQQHGNEPRAIPRNQVQQLLAKNHLGTVRIQLVSRAIYKKKIGTYELVHCSIPCCYFKTMENLNYGEERRNGVGGSGKSHLNRLSRLPMWPVISNICTL